MKKIVIMGASSGIGLRLAEVLASRGVRVGLAARHTAPLAALQKLYPDCVEYASVDVTRPKAVDHLHELIERLGGMDIYFHVAGIGYDNPPLDPEREVEIVRTNACGFARMISAVYRWMRDNHVAGQIAAVTSVAGTKGMGRLAAYSASKKFDQAYLTAIEQLARAEKADITITDIRPGWTRTPLLHADAVYPLEMSVDEVVRLALKAVVTRRRVAYVDWRWGVVARLWSMVPDCVWTRMDVPISTPTAEPQAGGESPEPAATAEES